MLAACCLTAQAQRMMEDLNRGLVAVQTEKGVFTSWRIHGTEYYDTQYNLYRDGKLVNPEPLDVSNPAVRCCSDGRICTGSTVGR